MVVELLTLSTGGTGGVFTFTELLHSACRIAASALGDPAPKLVHTRDLEAHALRFGTAADSVATRGGAFPLISAGQSSGGGSGKRGQKAKRGDIGATVAKPGQKMKKAPAMFCRKIP